MGFQVTDEALAKLDAMDDDGKRAVLSKLTPEERGQVVAALPIWRGKSKAPQQMPEPEEGGSSATRAGILGFAQGGTFGFADEIGGLVGKLTDRGTGVQLTPQAQAEMAAQGIPTDDRGAYDITRDLVRGEARAAKAAHPKTYMGGELAGALASAVVTPGGGAKSLGGAILSGAGVGAATGLGSSEADLTRGQYRQALVDTAKGAAIGAVTAGVGHGALRYAPAIIGAAGRGAQRLAVTQGRKVLLNGADQLSSRAPVSDAAVQEALSSHAIIPFGTTKGAANRLAATREALGKAYGEIVEDLANRGVEGPEAEAIAKEWMARANEEFANSGANKSVANVFRDEAQNLGAVNDPITGKLGLKQAEAIKRDLQKRARFERLQNSPTEEALQEMSSNLRGATESAIEDAALHAGPGSEIAEIATGFVPVKQRLSRVIEAAEAAKRGAAAAEKRASGLVPGPIEATQAVASGNPLALLAKPAVTLAKQRLPSTIASGADLAGRAATATANGLRKLPYGDLAPAALKGSSLAPASASALTRQSRPPSPVEALTSTLRDNPGALGPYAKSLQDAAARGPAALASTHFLLSQKDEAYRKTVESLSP